MTHLIVTRGPDQGARISLEGFPINIGRDASNDIVINDTEVSRNHARIRQRERLFIIDDLDSKNGIYLNGDKVFNSIIKNEDRILIGSTELVFLASQPEINIAENMMPLEFEQFQDSKFEAAVHLESEDHSTSFDPKRLNISQAYDLVAHSPTLIKKVFESVSGLNQRTDLTDLGRTIAKSLGELIIDCTKSCIFLWDSKNRLMTPLASKYFVQSKDNFAISKRSLYDCVNRKQPLILIPNLSEPTIFGPLRIVIPFLIQNEVIAVAHIESSSSILNIPAEDLSAAIILAGKSAHYLDGMILRKEQDAAMLGMIESFVAAIEAKDTYTSGHSERVCKYSIAIADQFHLSRDLKKQLMISALCHDVGKIGVPDAILKKAALLSSDEYDEMKLHPTMGAKIIERLPNAVRFMGGVKYHHEKWDGTGYPDGLIGENIPFFGRIISVADAFDAMVSGRSYSGFLDAADAIQKLNDEAELFDPEILKAFNKAWEHGIITQKSDTKAR